MKYRIYMHERRGYECLGTHSPKDTMKILDCEIVEKQTKNKILVIECDKNDNSEFPVFLYLGKQEEYDEFREYLNCKEEIVKRYIKKIKEK